LILNRIATRDAKIALVKIKKKSLLYANISNVTAYLEPTLFIGNLLDIIKYVVGQFYRTFNKFKS